MKKFLAVLAALALFGCNATDLMGPPMSQMARRAVPAMGVCPTSGYTRLVNVSTSAQLATAINSIKPGDQVRLAAGTYSNKQTQNVNGTAAAPITICSSAGAALTGGQFRFSGNYTTITGLLFVGKITEKVNLVFITAADYVTFKGNEITGGRYHAGVSVDAVSHITISGNYIHDNGLDSSTDHGIYFKTTTGPGNVVSGNLSTHNAARGMSFHDNTGVGVYDVLITGNTITNNGSEGILLNEGDRETIADNVIADNGHVNVNDQIRVVAGSGSNRLITHNLTWSSDPAHRGIDDEVGVTKVGNVVASPVFVSPTDFHLQATSPAIGLADPAYSVSPDFDGKVRDAAPDAGAFEF